MHAVHAEAFSGNYSFCEVTAFRHLCEFVFVLHISESTSVGDLPPSIWGDHGSLLGAAGYSEL